MRLRSIVIAAFPLAIVFALALPIVLPQMLVSTSAMAFQPASTSPQNQPSTQAKPATKSAPQNGEWRIIAPSDAMATILMPKKPRYIERSFTPVANRPPIKVHLHLATINEGKATYIFGYHDLHEVPGDARTLDKALEGAVRGSVLNVQGKLLSEVTKIRFKRSLGRQFNYRFIQNEKPFVVLSRVFIVGKRQYQISSLSLATEHNESLAVDFLNSFQLLTVENDEPPVPRIKN